MDSLIRKQESPYITNVSVLVSKAGIRFLVVVLSCPRLLCYGLAIVAPLFVLLGPGGLPYAS